MLLLHVLAQRDGITIDASIHLNVGNDSGKCSGLSNLSLTDWAIKYMLLKIKSNKSNNTCIYTYIRHNEVPPSGDVEIFWGLTHCCPGCHMAPWNWVNIGWGNGLLHDGIRALCQPMSTYSQRGFVAFTSVQFQRYLLFTYTFWNYWLQITDQSLWGQ